MVLTQWNFHFAAPQNGPNVPDFEVSSASGCRVLLNAIIWTLGGLVNGALIIEKANYGKVCGTSFEPDLL